MLCARRNSSSFVREGRATVSGSRERRNGKAAAEVARIIWRTLRRVRECVITGGGADPPSGHTRAKSDSLRFQARVAAGMRGRFPRHRAPLPRSRGNASRLDRARAKAS